MPGIKGFLSAARAKAAPAVSAVQSKAYGAIALGVAGGVGYYGGAKAYTAINQSIFEPYSMRNPRSVSTEGTMPNETMLFSNVIREQYKKGMTPGQFADNGDLTLSLNNLRRG